MAVPAQRDLLRVEDAIGSASFARAGNTLRYGVFGEIETTGETLQRSIGAVPEEVARALAKHTFVFVPLALGETGTLRETELARVYTAELAERATCHRTVPLDGETYTFISTRLMEDRFALAFELYINVGHQYVDVLEASKEQLPERFTQLVWQQAVSEIRGETSQEAYQARKRAVELMQESRAAASGHALESPQYPTSSAAESVAIAESRDNFFKAALADTLSIYMLSLAIDLDYADLREREYPLLAAPALADRLRVVAELFPAPVGYEFALKYRRRH